jgi:hypothetical protein
MILAIIIGIICLIGGVVLCALVCLKFAYGLLNKGIVDWNLEKLYRMLGWRFTHGRIRVPDKTKIYH